LAGFHPEAGSPTKKLRRKICQVGGGDQHLVGRQKAPQDVAAPFGIQLRQDIV